MRIGFISDLHIDINHDYDVMGILSSMISDLDALVIAGDISEKYEMTIDAVRDLRESSGIPVWYVPGNHDMWASGGLSNDEVYQKYVDDECCLSGKVVELDGISLTGDVGWYDYSLSYRHYDREYLDGMTHMGRTWQDKVRNTWTDDNISRCQMQLDAIEKQLESCRSDNIIVATHMLPNFDFTVRNADEKWDYFNAFLGTEKLQELFLRYPVKISVSGHVHYRKESDHDGIHFICPCLGYYSEWKLYDPERPLDARYHIEKSLWKVNV